jgi:hypothetical protein
MAFLKGMKISPLTMGFEIKIHFTVSDLLYHKPYIQRSSILVESAKQVFKKVHHYY